MKKLSNTKLKDMKAITLIALVITIVILIILAGVLISLTLGNNGLFNKAKLGKELYSNAQDYEETEIAKMTNNIDIYSSRDDLESTISRIIDSKLSQPTGVKTDTYIMNKKNDATSTFGNNITSMSGLEISKDENNKIDEYLSYSSTDGYTVLKSGWYMIELCAAILNNTNTGAAVNIDLCLNNDEVYTGTYVQSNSSSDMNNDYNTFPIYFKEGDKFYFTADKNTNTVTYRSVSAFVNPMF